MPAQRHIEPHSVMRLGSLHPPLDLAVPPAAVVWPVIPLIAMHCTQLGIDYILLRRARQNKTTTVTLRVVLGGIHAALPMLVTSRYDGCNLFLAAVPWFYATYTATLPLERLTVRDWMEAFNAIVLDAPDTVRARIADGDEPADRQVLAHVDARGARQNGVMRMLRGAAKLIVMRYAIDPLLPANPAWMLSLPYFDPASLGYTLLYGCKAYTFLGVADIGMGLQQLLLGLPQIDLFDAPMLATSPKDFWSRRWSRPMRNLLHRVFFVKMQQQSECSAARCGMMAFIASGMAHELLVMCLCRRLTLENLLFFALHGGAVGAQMLFTRRQRNRISSTTKSDHPTSVDGAIAKQQQRWWVRPASIAGNLAFLAVTGRLFLAPYLRHYALSSS